ncbi:MAG: YlxM family DNA-binding protein [Clostridia bacterium]|nr:YlxM family DNA-binding protein [Clostridia bacterium]
MEDSRWTRSMLLDFYGELLTEKQRTCFDLHYNEDLSLSEIAEMLGISRQGAWDNIRRAELAMEDVEKKTGLIGRFEENRSALEKLMETLDKLSSMTEGGAKELCCDAQAQVRSLILRG